MCASCGCGTLNDNHGDSRNITLNQLQSAAEAAKISLKEVGDNLTQAVGSGDAATAKAEMPPSQSR